MKRVYKIGFLSIVFLFCLIMGSIAMANASPDIKLRIAYNNLAFEDNVYILYAVDSEGVSDETKIKVLIWNSPQTEYAYGTQDKILDYNRSMEIKGENYPVFVLDTLSAKQMTEEVYAVAYYDGFYSSPNKYSILQYAKNKIGTTQDEGLKNLLVSMLEYGTCAQTYYDYNTDRLANETYYSIYVENGCLSDGFTKGLYKSGQTITLFAETTQDGKTFDCWKDETGTIIDTKPSVQVIIGTNDKRYTAVYAAVSVGLEFESNEDGTCALIGIGDCEDTDIVIPSRSPEGDLVTGIDSAAFRNEDITSVTIPIGVEEIGRNAFNGCDALTDVYYAGTITQWENIDIKSGNAPLLSATLHTNDVAHTVTFKDYDGSVLKVEQVNDGSSATVPIVPARAGYRFTGWNADFTVVTADLDIYAEYETERNQLYFSYEDNGNGTVTAVLKVCGEVNLYGLEFNLYMDLVNCEYNSVTAVAAGAAANFANGYVKFSYAANSGTDITSETELLRLTLTKSGDNYSINLSLQAVDIFDQNYNDETYSVANSDFVK
ncbi:MAG: InlB B-repeat-containing protein [Clostridia bacterium]|nr:InlB B-repeat-containing protein [Clostridia bacterium]